jgi:hypothetical protein
MSLKPMYVWDGSAWVQVGDASTPQTTIDIAQSAPQGAITGSIWYDDDAGGLFVYDGQYWVNISGPQGPQGVEGPQGPAGQTGILDVAYSSASPVGASAGYIWFDNTDINAINLKVYNGTDWVEVSGTGSSLKANYFMTMGA